MKVSTLGRLCWVSSLWREPSRVATGILSLVAKAGVARGSCQGELEVMWMGAGSGGHHKACDLGVPRGALHLGAQVSPMP